MRKIVLLIILLTAVSLSANGFKLIEFRSLPADFHAERNSVTDMDREYCAALKVEIDVPLNIDLKQKVYKKEKINSQSYYFFVTHKEKQITFTAPNYAPLTVDVPKDGLKRGVVFYVRLESIPDVTVTLNVDPKPDRIILDNRIMDKNRFRTAPGTYRLQIEKSGYEPIDEEITIDDQNSFFNYTLGKKSEIQVVEKVVEIPADEPVEEVPGEPARFRLERFDLIFEVISCEMYEKQIVLEINILNQGDDRDVTLLGWGGNRTRIFDDAGNEFFPKKLNFANKSSSSDVKIMLVNGVPTKASLIFRDINKKAESITKFDLGIWTKQSDGFRATFRNIPIEKK